MAASKVAQQLDQSHDSVPLQPQIVGRFYGDGNRLGQRPAEGSAARVLLAGTLDRLVHSGHQPPWYPLRRS